MLSALLAILTFILIIVSLFLVMVVLMQKSKDGGMGATLGGGAAEQAFGAETGNVLSRSTIVAAIAFFVLAFLLYLGRIYERRGLRNADDNALPAASALGVPAPTTPAPAAPTAPVTPATAPATAPAPTLNVPTSPTPAPDAKAPATTTPAAPTPEAPKKQ